MMPSPYHALTMPFALADIRSELRAHIAAHIRRAREAKDRRRARRGRA